MVWEVEALISVRHRLPRLAREVRIEKQAANRGCPRCQSAQTQLCSLPGNGVALRVNRTATLPAQRTQTPIPCLPTLVNSSRCVSPICGPLHICHAASLSKLMRPGRD